MAQGKYLSLEEARKMGKLDQFAKQFRNDPPNHRFWPVFRHIIENSRVDDRTSVQGNDDDYSGTQIPLSTSPSAS